jgi:hypothetical protein
MWVPHLIEMLFDGLTDFEVIDVAQEINSKFSVAHQFDAPIFHSALIAWKWPTSYSLPDFQITGDTTLPSPLLRLRGSDPPQSSGGAAPRISTARARISRRQLSGLGKMRTTWVRRLSSWLSRSSTLVLSGGGVLHGQPRWPFHNLQRPLFDGRTAPSVPAEKHSCFDPGRSQHSSATGQSGNGCI